jgi:transcriptional regulator with XRE-family HTH domain
MSPIRAWRDHHGLSHSDLAQAAGLTDAQLMEIEGDTRTPSPAALRRLRRCALASTI